MIEAFVLDASVTLAWCFPEEATPYTERMLDLMRNGAGATTPMIWPLEVSNVIRLSERRGRITLEEGERLIRFAHGLSIRVKLAHLDDIFGPIADLARSERLTVYDATYVHLAKVEGLPLASIDGSLSAAARRQGVEVLD